MQRDIMELDPVTIMRFVPRMGDEMAVHMFERLVGMDKECYRGFAAHEEGQVLGLCAVVRLWDGVAMGALTFAEDAMTSPYNPTSRWLHKAITSRIKQVADDLGLWRIETSVHRDYPGRADWIKRLGFNYEGISRKYGPDGADYSRFAWVI